MTNLSGTYYNGLRPIGLHAEMKIDNMGVVLTAGNIFERYSIYDVIVSPRIGSAPRFINLPNGSQFECKNHDILDTLPQESPTEGPVAWLEKRWPIAFVSVIMVFFLLALGYFFGLPAAAKHIVERIPIETEQSLGINAVAWLDKNGFLKPTNLGNNTQNEIIDGFKKLCKDLPFQKYYSLSFRSGILGPNALAFSVLNWQNISGLKVKLMPCQVSSGPPGSERSRFSRASASARSFVLPDARLLRMRSATDGMCTRIPSTSTGSAREKASSNCRPDAVVIMSIRRGATPI